MVATAITCVLLISILFLFIFMGMHEAMATEHERIERYVFSTTGNAVHVIRNEILFLFENYSEEMREMDFSDWDGDVKSLPLKEVHQLVDFPRIIVDTYFVRPGEIRKPSEEYAEMMPFYLEFLKNMTSDSGKKNISLINIYNLQGFMAFPVKQGSDGGLMGYLVVILDIRHVVEEYLPARLRAELDTSEKGGRRDTKQEYFVFLKEGEKLRPDKTPFLIDLNRDFNLFNLQDYYYTRPDAFFSLMKNHTITDNHTYLVVYHREAEPGAFLKKKIRNYLLLSVLYLFLVGVLLLFLYSVYRIKREFHREQQFTSLISHELKTPLSVIQLASDSLAGGFVTEKENVAEYGDMIKNETGRLGRMIENILLISTLSWSGAKMESLSVETLLEEIKGAHQALMRKFAIHWIEENHLGSRYFSTNASLLKAALQNLVHNGIIYGADRSDDKTLIFRVELQRRRREGILFSVIDHGPGISRNEAQKIFDSYYRGQDIRENQLPGSGMGLALSRKIAEGLGGTLTLNRSVKGETAFELWIPLRKYDEKNTDD